MGTVEVELKFGMFFEEKYGKDPRELTLQEIEALAIKKKAKGYRSSSNVVISRGSVFENKYYEIDKMIDRVLFGE
jgi:hypothetical protein